MPEFVAIDFETANEKWHSACAIGLAMVEDGCIVHSESHLIRPHELRFAYRNIDIHGITEDDVRGAPTLPELWPTIWRRLEGKLVVAHNAKFDVGVLRHAMHANEMDFPEFDYLCSAAVSREIWPDAVSFSLGFLAPWLGIELDHHEPESDARASAQIVLQALEKSQFSCPREMSRELSVRIGHIYPNGEWQPCSGPSRGAGSTREWLEIDLPDGYRIEEHLLHDKNVLITGDLDFCTKDNALAIIEQLGGHPMKGFAKRIDVLVSGRQDLSKLAKGEKMSSKMKKTLDLRASGKPVEVITADDLFDAIFDVAVSDAPKHPEER